ncbi:hypothetical protein ACFL6B_02630, partial [Thermodesulfobacteriota bacterium]
SNIIDQIGGYRRDIIDYAALCENIHVIYWDQIFNSLQNIQSANRTELNFMNLTDYLNDKLI